MPDDGAPRGAPLRVEMWFDVICPWCRIGLVQLDAAIAAQPWAAAEVELRPFRLHPDWPAEGVPWAEFQRLRGLPDAVFRRVEAAGAAHGLGFDFRRAPRVPDTAPLHRLILAAGRQGAARQAYDALAAAYFDRAEDLAQPGAVADALRAAGLPPRADAPEMQGALLAAEAEARRLHVTGVPFFRFGGRTVLAGAAGVAALLAAMDAAVSGRGARRP